MTQRFSFACLFVLLFLVGCKEKAEVTESISSLETQGGGVTNVSESLPLPSEQFFADLGPLNDLDTRWLVSNPVYVTAGRPHRFLTSPIGQGNAAIVNGMLAQFLQVPLEFDNIDRFLQGLNTPVAVVVEVMENGVRVPRQTLLNRRVTVLTCVDPTKPEDFLQRFLPPMQSFEEIPRRKVGHHEIFDLTPPNLAVPQKLVLYFADDKTVVIVEGDEPSIQEVFAEASPKGAAIERIRRADIANNDFVLVASREGVPFNATEIQFALQQYGVPSILANTLAAHFRAVTLRANLQAEDGKPMLVATLETTSTKASEEISEIFLGYVITGQTTIASLDEAGKNLLPLPADFALSLLNSLTIATDEGRIDTTLVKFSGFDVAAAKGMTDAQARIQKQWKEEQQHDWRLNQLVTLSRAFVEFYRKNEKFPTSILSEDGTPLLSWRVALLPIIGREELYKKFKLDEPWDGPANKPLLEEIPPIFASSVETVEKTKTSLRYFDSEGTPFADKELKPESLKAPQSTLLLVDVSPEQVVEWTRPDSMDFDVEKIEETVGNVLFGVSFAGRPIAIPIIPLSDPRSALQREHIISVVQGRPLAR